MGTQCEHVRRSTGGGFRCFVGARPSYAGVALVGAVDRFPLQDALGSEGCLRVANRPPRLCPPETGFLDGRLRYWRMSGAGLAHVGALDSFRGSCVSVVCRRACPLSDALRGLLPPSAGVGLFRSLDLARRCLPSVHRLLCTVLLQRYSLFLCLFVELGLYRRLCWERIQLPSCVGDRCSQFVRGSSSPPHNGVSLTSPRHEWATQK